MEAYNYNAKVSRAERYKRKVQQILKTIYDDYVDDCKYSLADFYTCCVYGVSPVVTATRIYYREAIV